MGIRLLALGQATNWKIGGNGKPNMKEVYQVYFVMRNRLSRPLYNRSGNSRGKLCNGEMIQKVWELDSSNLIYRM